MKYNELNRAEKMSFQKTISNYLQDILVSSKYELALSDFITKEFVSEVCVYLEENASFQKWAQSDLEIDEGEVEEIISEKVKKMRKKKPTEKQIEYYIGMAQFLRQDETVPTDYLVFQRNLLALKERYSILGPATDKQIDVIKKVWLKTFGEELTFENHPTREEINNLFARITESQRKPQTGITADVIDIFTRKKTLTL